jgi:hypothetical protein
MDLKHGSLVLIPCQACGNAMLPFTVEWGTYHLPCPNCHCALQIDVKEEQGRPRIRTQIHEKQAPGSRG